MPDSIAVYVKPGAEHNMLNFYIPAALKAAFVAAVANGSLELPSDSINFEVVVLPQWIAESGQKLNARHPDEPVSVGIPLKAINFHFSED